MSKDTRTGEACPLVPVMGQGGCAGHLLRTHKGFRAFNAEGKEIGMFENLNLAASALLDEQTTEATD